MKRLVILGAGGYGRTVADVAAQSDQFEPIIFLDDNSAAADVVGKCADYLECLNADTVILSGVWKQQSSYGLALPSRSKRLRAADAGPCHGLRQSNGDDRAGNDYFTACGRQYRREDRQRLPHQLRRDR